MSSSEFTTEHIQPTIEYEGTADNTHTTPDVPEVVIVAETEDDTSEAEMELDTSTILAADDRDGYDEDAVQSTAEQLPHASETVADEEDAEANAEENTSATEKIPHTTDETEGIAVDVYEPEELPVLEAKETRKAADQTVGEAVVEAVLEYLEGDGEDDGAKADVVKPEPAAAAETPVETVNQETQPEAEEPAAAELPAEVDDQAVAAEALTDVNAVVDTAVEQDVREDTPFVDPILGGVAVSGGLPDETKGDGNGDAKGTDIRELAEQTAEGDAPEAVAEVAEETETVTLPQSPLGFVLAQLPTPETPVQQPVGATNEAATPMVDNVAEKPEAIDDVVVHEAPSQIPAYSAPQSETVETRSAGEEDAAEDEAFSPIALQNPQMPKFGPELPTFKSDQSKLSRILEGIGTGASIAGTLTVAGLSASSLPVRVAMTKIDDRQVKHESLFTYKITVQGGGKSQTITVTSPFGRTYAKFRARVQFARDKLAP